MKPNELMIGDWISVMEIPAQVFELSYDNEEKEMTIGILDPQGEVYSCYYGFDHVEPIPLTEEILEENFLTQRGEWTEPVLYFFGNDYIEVSIKEYTDGIWEIVVDEVEMSGLPSWRMYVSDVHQLQHALRLCNIDKEIEL